jgi:hypothetical protein
MSTDFEQRLRAEMEQVKVSPRPGLVNEAYRSYRGKRRLIRALAATGTAMAIAAGTAAGVAAATASPTVIPAQTAAYVLSRVSSALATSDEISYTIITYSLNPSVAVEQVGYTWKYGTRSRNLVDTASGQPVTDSWAQTGVSQTLVLYPDRVWARYGFTPRPWSFACAAYAQTFPILAEAGPVDLSSIIKSGLRCGVFRVAGHQRVDGIDTIKLTGSSYHGRPTVTLWVNSRTYLPVQGTGFGTSMKFRWLPPTQANLAQLTGTIPPGFHRGG